MFYPEKTEIFLTNKRIIYFNPLTKGEEGQDAGGLLREWYVIISREIFNPMYALFTVSPGDRVTYMINSSSHCNPNHLCYYKFVGRVIGKSLRLKIFVKINEKIILQYSYSHYFCS